MNQIFIVGCPRSGTTLLESMLAVNSAIMTFPESHLFLPGRFQSVSLIAAYRAQRELRRFQRCVDGSSASPYSCRPASVHRRFACLLDELAHAAGATSWIEKTPDHVFHIETIRRTFARPRFIHLVRDGRAVVASLYEVTRKYPVEWLGEWSLERCVEHWNRALRASLCEFEGKAEDSVFVRYESLVADTELTLASLCRALGVEFAPEMASDDARRAAGHSAVTEPWKLGVLEPVRSEGLAKFESLFPPFIRDRIIANLEQVPDAEFSADPRAVGFGEASPTTATDPTGRATEAHV